MDFQLRNEVRKSFAPTSTKKRKRYINEWQVNNVSESIEELRMQANPAARNLGEMGTHVDQRGPNA